MLVKHCHKPPIFGLMVEFPAISWHFGDGGAYLYCFANIKKKKKTSFFHMFLSWFPGPMP